MRLFLRTFFSFFLFIPSLAQSLQVEKIYNSLYYELGGLEINLTSDNINISKDNQNIYSENISGEKIFKTSPVTNYFLIASFQFSDKKVDYPVEVRIFDKNGLLVFPYKFLAPFDLPHPLLNLNDNGLFALFDPLNFKVKLISEEIYKEIELEKEAPFEMEKAAYIEMNEDFFFILTSRIALDITENASNASLYKINLVDFNVDKKTLDYNTPTMLKLIGGNLFVSGVKFENLKPVGKTIKYDLGLNQLASNEKIVEEIIPSGNKFFAKYFNNIFEFDGNMSISREKLLSDEARISYIAVWNEELIATTSKASENNIVFFSPDLKVLYEESLKELKINELNDISISNSSLILHFDSKSAKIKTN